MLILKVIESLAKNTAYRVIVTVGYHSEGNKLGDSRMSRDKRNQRRNHEEVSASRKGYRVGRRSNCYFDREDYGVDGSSEAFPKGSCFTSIAS